MFGGSAINRSELLKSTTVSIKCIPTFSHGLARLALERLEAGASRKAIPSTCECGTGLVPKHRHLRCQSASEHRHAFFGRRNNKSLTRISFYTSDQQMLKIVQNLFESTRTVVFHSHPGIQPFDKRCEKACTSAIPPKVIGNVV